MEDKGGLQKGLTDVAKGISKTTNKIIKSTKLTISLSSEESKLKSAYLTMGKEVSRLYKEGAGAAFAPWPLFDEQCAAIELIEARIADIKRQRAEGAKVEEAEDITPVDNGPPPISHEQGGRVCRACGAVNEVADKFCLTCGRIV